jgi:hypothetical protein
MLNCVIQITTIISKGIYHTGQCPEFLDMSLKKGMWIGLKKSNGHDQTTGIFDVP